MAFPETSDRQRHPPEREKSYTDSYTILLVFTVIKFREPKASKMPQITNGKLAFFLDFYFSCPTMMVDTLTFTLFVFIPNRYNRIYDK